MQNASPWLGPIVILPSYLSRTVMTVSRKEARFRADRSADGSTLPYLQVLMLSLRRSEALGLHWLGDAPDQPRSATGRRRAAGTTYQDPTIPSDRALAAVRRPGAPRASRPTGGRRDRAWHWEDTPYVFTSTVGTPIEPRTLTRTFHALCERHGLRRVRFHDLRHSCVSLLLTLGVNPRVVMEIVGHSAIEMTMNVEGHVSLDNQRAALDLLNAQLTAVDEDAR